ncbi:MAG: ATP-dependent DNA ligase [Bryobacteraceae bacterium]|nr:ATP-dependent DNA ligase [Bryobacteraceae bacterium]
MLLADVVAVSQQIGETTKRKQKVEMLSALLRLAGPGELEPVVAFLSGSTRHGRIGIGYATLRASRAEAAVEASLTISDVEKTLDQVTELQGAGSDKRKRELLGWLFSKATGSEQTFLMGLLSGELRQGALEGIMLEGLACAFAVDASRVRRAAMLTGNLVAVARSLQELGPAGLDSHGIQMFRPVQPMLAETAEDASDAVGLLGQAALEYKFDGARIQVHKSGDEVRVFSRRLNEVTLAVPEVVESVLGMPEHDLILDGEVIALDPGGRPHPFQITMRRFGRRLDVAALRTQLPLTPVWFDVLRIGSTDVIDEPQATRFEALQAVVAATELVPSLITADPAEASRFFEGALAKGHEGIMAKALDGTYAAGARGKSWLKVKRARTLDLVILAAEWGNGRRVGFLSNLHLGARDVERGGFAMLGKTFKGLTDEMLAWQTQELQKREISRDSYTVYVEPSLVVEIAFNEIQVSSTYVSGLALRFARVKRYRPDRSAADSDTFQTVLQLAAEMSQSS